jgi:HSP20 family protein
MQKQGRFPLRPRAEESSGKKGGVFMTLTNLVPWSFGKKRVPVRHYDYDPFTSLQREMDTLFENFFHGSDADFFGGRTSSFSPSVEVKENEKEIKVSAELPGLSKKDIDLSLSHDSLTISGEKKEEHEKNEKDCYMKERSYGSFRRIIPLYCEIDTDKVDAHFKKGVLTITLPKSAREMEKKKKIPVTIDK